MATPKKPVAKVVTKKTPTAKPAVPGQFSESGKQPKFVRKESKPVQKATVKKATVKKPAVKPAVKSVIKTESKAKTAVKAVKEVVKKVVAKAAPVAAPSAPVAKRVSRKITPKPAEVKSALPVEVEVKQPWDSVEGDKLQAKAPPSGTSFPLVPLMIPGRGTEFFSHIFDHKLNIEINGASEVLEVKTGYLSVNRTIDLLALSQSDDLISLGYVHPTDTLYDKLKLASLHIQIKGKDKFIDCTSINHVAVTDGRTMKLELTVVVNDEGKNYAITINGTIHPEMGSCYVAARSNPDVEVRGYFLDAVRCNYNRRPA